MNAKPFVANLPSAVRRGALVVGVLSIVVAVAMAVLLDPSAHKARVEQAASRALGMEVRIDGHMALHWRPGAHLVLEDVHARQRGVDVAVARQVRVEIGLLSLLRDRPEIHDVVLDEVALTIVRERSGRFNFESDDAAGESRPLLREGPDVSFSRATLAFVDARRDIRIEGRACYGDLRHLEFAGAPARAWIAGLSFDANAGCSEVHLGEVAASDVALTAAARRGIIEVDPIGMRLFGARAASRVRMDYTAPTPDYHVEHTMRRFPIEALLNTLSIKEVANGRMDLTVSLTMRGKDADDLQRSMQGTVSLRGQGLAYRGGDLDAQFERLESSQSFSLVDVGAVLLAGPMGLLVSKGYEFATIATGGRGSSEIRTLVSDWSIDRGMAQADDVAMATRANRVALRGGIDLANDRFDGMSIALIDADGCVKVQQSIRGSLHKPVLDKPNRLKTLAGPVVSLLKKGAELLGDDRCDVFYAGSVASPK